MSDLDPVVAHMQLYNAIKIASDAHRHQVDKSGRPYILHPLRVMCAMPIDHPEAQIVAVLHDVIEDASDKGYNVSTLALAGFSKTVLRALDHISQRPGELYWDYIDRCAQNDLALKVKLADLNDNMSDSRRFPGDEGLMKRYRRAVDELQKRLF